MDHLLRRKPTIFFLTLTLFILIIIMFQNRYKHPGLLYPNFHHFEYEKAVLQPKLSKKESLFLLILVSSNPQNLEKQKNRESIRKTWGNCSHLKLSKNITCQLVFMLGRSRNDDIIKVESSKYSDILMFDYNDSYKTISRKLLSSFKWAEKLSAKFILKADDDVVVHSAALVKKLKHIKDPYFYGGNVWAGSVPRESDHRHYVTKEQYQYEYFPPFCKGALYILSGKVVERLNNAVPYVNVFGVDDAYVGVVMRYLGISPVHITEILIVHPIFVKVLELLPNCFFENLIGLGHNLSGQSIIDLYKVLENSDNVRNLHFFCFFIYLSILVLCISLISCAFSMRRKKGNIK